MRDYKRSRIKNERLKIRKIKRQNKKVSPVKSRRAFYFAIFLGSVFLSLLLLLKFAPRSWLDIEFLKTKDIRVIGNKNISEKEVKKLSEIEGKNFLSLNLVEAAKRIVENPWIKIADLRRRFPNKISIAIQERSPFAYVQTASLNLIDEEGVILRIVSEIEKKELPVITGFRETSQLNPGDKITSPNINMGIETLKEIRDKNLIPISDISTLDISNTFNPVLTLKRSPGQIYLGIGDLDEKVKKLKTLYENKNEIFPAISYIDLRFKDRVIVMPQKQEAKKNKGDSL